MEALAKAQFQAAMGGAKFRNASSYTYSPGYTFPGNLPTELFFNPTVGTPALSDIFKIRQGIRTDEYLILVNALNKIVGTVQGCEPSYTTAGTLSDRKITVTGFAAYLKWCKEDFIATASVLTNDPSWVADGLDGYDASAKIRRLWMDAMIDALRRDYFRLAFFGNDASGDTFWKQIDGLFVKLYDGNSAYCVKRVGNSLGNNHNTALGTDDALNALKATFNGAQTALKQIPAGQKHFLVNGDMYDNLCASYESKSGGTEMQFRYLENGTSNLKFRGVDVVPLYIADDVLRDDTACPWYDNLRHFAIYTPKPNSQWGDLVLGTERGSDLDRIKMFFDEYNDTTYAKHESKWGVQYINCDLIAFHD